MTSLSRILVAVVTLATLISCGTEEQLPLMTTPDGKLKLVDSVTTDGSLTMAQEAVRKAINTPPGIDAVVVHGDQATRGAVAAKNDASSQTLKDLRIISIGRGTDPIPEFVRRKDVTSVILSPDHGESAIDLAVLAALGIQPPKRDLLLGTAKLTQESVSFGGEKLKGPDTPLLERFLIDNQRILTTPDDQRVLRIGVSLAGTTPEERARVINSIERRAKSYRRTVRLEVKDTKQRPKIQPAQVRELVDAEVDAIVLAPSSAEAVARLVKQAGKIPVIMIHSKIADASYTCSLSTAPELLGVAAGVVVRSNYYEGGRIITLMSSGEPDSAAYQEAFLKRLLFQPVTAAAAAAEDK